MVVKVDVEGAEHEVLRGRPEHWRECQALYGSWRFAVLRTSLMGRIRTSVRRFRCFGLVVALLVPLRQTGVWCCLLTSIDGFSTARKTSATSAISLRSPVKGRRQECLWTASNRLDVWPCFSIVF
jgi:hypothetical protein